MRNVHALRKLAGSRNFTTLVWTENSKPSTAILRPFSQRQADAFPSLKAGIFGAEYLQPQTFFSFSHGFLLSLSDIAAFLAAVLHLQRLLQALTIRIAAISI